MSDEQTAIPTLDEFTRRLRNAMSGAQNRNGVKHNPNNPNDAPRPRSKDAAPADREGPIGGDPATWGPIGQGEYVVQGNDCMSSLGARTGHLWQTIWDDPANTQLRDVRRDPNVLAIGDRVTIPPLRQKTDAGQTEMRHRFVRLGQPTIFQLRLAHNNKPIAHREYTIKFDNGDESSSTTNSGGFLRCRMPSQAKHAKLKVQDGEQEREYELNFGRLEPVEHLCGVQQRLKNLGFFDGPADGTMDKRTRSAIEYYQKRRGLQQTGVVDVATRKKLQEEHGS